MSAKIYDFSVYQEKAKQNKTLINLGWAIDSFNIKPNKALNIYLADKNLHCLRFFNCNFNEIQSSKRNNDIRLQLFLDGWDLISHPASHATPKHQKLTFQLAKRVIAALPAWQNLHSQQRQNQLADTSHVVVLIDQHGAKKPLELILIQTAREHLSPSRIHYLLSKNKLRHDVLHATPIWDVTAEQ
ncbi:MAG: hypothetical protein HRU20_05585 [Pseudomonadales bacterium]|nr:hypothetical protein [Pseudomonadales bacterium]